MTEKGRTILIVDDEPDILETIRGILEDEGYTILQADSGEHALKIVEERGDVDLMLSDIRMPGRDGIETMDCAKKLRPGLPVILMTAYASKDREERALASGAYSVVHKPFDINLMLRLITSALQEVAVLVVDPLGDERGEALQIFLAYGYRVAVAHDAAEALRLIDTQPVDVVLLELERPEACLQTLHELQAADPSLLVLVLTQDPPPDLLGGECGLTVSALIHKPVAPSQLAHLVAEARGAEMR